MDISCPAEVPLNPYFFVYGCIWCESPVWLGKAGENSLWSMLFQLKFQILTVNLNFFSCVPPPVPSLEFTHTSE